MTPTVHTNVHILSDLPAVTTNAETYPSFVVSERSGEVIDFTTVNITVTGDADDRIAFAAELRRLADFFESWSEGRRLEADSLDDAQVPA